MPALDETNVGAGNEITLPRTHPGYREQSFYPLISPRSYISSNSTYRQGYISFFYFRIHESVLIKNFWVAPRNDGVKANFAIYQIENGKPEQRLYSIGEITTVSGEMSLPFNESLAPDFYAFAYMVQDSFQDFIGARDTLEEPILQGTNVLNSFSIQRRLDATFSYSSNMPVTAPAITATGSTPMMVWIETGGS